MRTELPQLVQQAANPEKNRALATRSGARLMSLLEDEPARLPQLLHAIASLPDASVSRRSPRLVLGITGAPGSGKSTLTDALVHDFLERHPEDKVGVVAVDPSSPFTGGAVLGDRVRMMRHATNPRVFVRSLATRGHLGGLTLGVKGVVAVMGLLGCGVVIVETVGVGQSEVEIARLADLVAVVLAPGQGDSVQMLKAGLMEIGDLFVVNKADRPGASRLHAQLLAALSLGQSMHQQHTHDLHHSHHDEHADDSSLPIANCDAPPAAEPLDAEDADTLALAAQETAQVSLVSAAEDKGIAELVVMIESLASELAEAWRDRRQRRVAKDVFDAVLDAARSKLINSLSQLSQGEELANSLLLGDLSVDELATRVISHAALSTLETHTQTSPQASPQSATGV